MAIGAVIAAEIEVPRGNMDIIECFLKELPKLLLTIISVMLEI